MVWVKNFQGVGAIDTTFPLHSFRGSYWLDYPSELHVRSFADVTKVTVYDVTRRDLDAAFQRVSNDLHQHMQAHNGTISPDETTHTFRSIVPALLSSSRVIREY